MVDSGSGAVGQSDDSSRGLRSLCGRDRAGLTVVPSKGAGVGGQDLSPLPPCLAFVPAPSCAASAMAIFIPCHFPSTPWVEAGEGGRGVRGLRSPNGSRVGKAGGR